MELIMKNGRAFWTPATGDVTNINCFAKWEQAFHIYSKVYTSAHPQKASELIQYNHIIHTISMSYIWENVYSYDKEFHLHISKHPNRSWAIILQQAWMMRLKDRLRFEVNNNSGMRFSQGSHAGGNQTQKGEACRRFNRGRCNFGQSCKYDHRWTYCGKFGHGFFSCRKAAADRDKKSTTAFPAKTGLKFDDKPKVDLVKK